jgi:hypothetical protein
MAGPTGFEPAISSVTGWHVGPLHHGPAAATVAEYSRGGFGASDRLAARSDEPQPHDPVADDGRSQDERRRHHVRRGRRT